MKRFKTRQTYLLFILILSVFLITGCGHGGGGAAGASAAAPTAPTVSAVVPANAATGVAINTAVSATFSEAMNSTTIISPATTFTLTQGGTAVAGKVTYSGVTAVFTPTSNLASSTTYTATITTGATAQNGLSLASSYSWTFTTGAAPDTTPPTVSLTIPANAATGVPINTAISAAFSKAMNPLTITNQTFTLTTGGTAVAGAVTYSGVTAVFTPLSNLASGTTYTATISTGATDATVTGNALASSYSWTFTTAAAPDTTPPTVSLTIPANAATGVPINTAISAVFSKAMNPLTITNQTFTLTTGGTAVAGAVTYSSVTAIFTPTSNLAAGTTYTATIITGARDATVTGNALASNYSWTFTTAAAIDKTPPTVTLTVPANAATGVPINTAISAAFSKAMNPLTITNQTFTLTTGGTAVAGAVTYSGVTAVFTPLSNLAAGTTYTATITTGATDATVTGNALASNYSWTFTTAAAIDKTPPTVTLTIPANAATGVPINTAISAVFSKAMNPLTITNQTFTLTTGGTAVAGAVTYSGVTAVFTPLSNLAAGATYTATITTGATDATVTGNALASNYVWTFTTAAAIDKTPPTVTLTVPANAATGVAINTAISAAFSKAMNPLSLTNQTFTLTAGGTAVAGAVTYSGVTAVFTPLSDLASGTTYTATITTGARDATVTGNALASNYVWTFTTAAAIDTTPPTVILTSPVNGATGVCTNGVTATFSKTMNPLTLTNQTFTVAGVTGTVTYDPISNIATFTPVTPSSLASSTTYNPQITTGAKDATVTGNALASNYNWSFTTGTASACAPPVVPTGINATLGILSPYAIASAAGVSNTGATKINGDVVFDPTATCNAVAVPGGSATAGFGLCGGDPPINNAVDTVTTTSSPDTTTAAAVMAVLKTEYGSITPAQMPGATVLGCGTIGSAGGGGAGIGCAGNSTLPPGTYISATSSTIGVTGTLTLDGQGNPNAQFVFQAPSALTTATNSTIILVNGAKASNVWWQVGSSATLGVNSAFYGNILAAASITMNNGATSCGRLLAGATISSGAFVFGANVVSVPGHPDAPAGCQ
ncbi:MAG: Ig-like domain-containing protein [Dissulfurispiraceae bacterium]